jgi:hypothetical protein
MARCPDCCLQFPDEAAMRDHIEQYHDEETLESVETASHDP